ncbi:Protein of unknown function [Bacillus thuringiensis]|uniref:Uncharacterized protein n=1 Tax=Bacillus thuringiensis TaxID=1428 RepID=A0A1C4E9I8_BACTU|nr:hypothetical protein [Bacillus thuringiensis]OTY00538.1 hypothetical protein BK729_09845 [Bacillus thuringiensis serovar wratislaviensis]OUB61905.1 hypothetical protein BK743_07195 [Bacillus thuringiensis serovar sylvestriensis]SCC40191.1 Protein of unknown function [Bacillus thuringiensis]HDR7779026.1 hypothetical protein [Bacillus tropicus]
MVSNVHGTDKRATSKKRFINTILSIPLVALALFLLASADVEMNYFILITFISVIIIIFQLVYFYKQWKVV